MKFQLKALAAALVLAAVAVPAQASIDSAVTGNSSFILTVFDKVANISAAFDLGKNYSDFNLSSSLLSGNGSGVASNVNAAGTSFSWDLAANADYSTAWSTFLASATLANTTYAITAADGVGTGAASRGYITTLATNSAANLSTSAVVTAIGNFQTYTNGLPFAPSTFENHSTVADGSNVATAAPASTLYNSNRVGGTTVGATTVGAIGSSLGVVQVLTGASSFANTTQTVFSNQYGVSTFTLGTNGKLSYVAAVAPVPEADTWAMMLLGLGFMGFVARRKQA